MTRIPTGALLLVLLLSGTSTSCWFRKAKAAPPPALPPPPPVDSSKPPQLPPSGPAPETSPPLPVPPSEAPKPGPTPPAETEEPRTRPRASRPSKPVKPGAPAPAPNSLPPETPLPQLGPILTAQQRDDYLRAIESAIERAQRGLASIQGRTLTQEQATTVMRIQTFLAQAREARKTDLPTAKSLAERADVLTRDLVNNLK